MAGFLYATEHIMLHEQTLDVGHQRQAEATRATCIKNHEVKCYWPETNLEGNVAKLRQGEEND